MCIGAKVIKGGLVMVNFMYQIDWSWVPRLNIISRCVGKSVGGHHPIYWFCFSWEPWLIYNWSWLWTSTICICFLHTVDVKLWNIYYVLSINLLKASPHGFKDGMSSKHKAISGHPVTHGIWIFKRNCSFKWKKKNDTGQSDFCHLVVGARADKGKIKQED